MSLDLICAQRPTIHTHAHKYTITIKLAHLSLKQPVSLKLCPQFAGRFEDTQQPEQEKGKNYFSFELNRIEQG